MSEAIHIGIAGLGTVGSGTVRILQQQAVLLAERSGRKLVIAGVSAHSKNKKRNCDVSGIKWFDNPVDMATNAGVSIVVEAIGGADGVARELVETALKNGKPVVTANKALIAKHGLALAQLAEKHKVTLAFEAAVAGGIPIIKALRDGLSANHFSHIAGILNGTCNYILTRMWNEKLGFDEVLKDAQAKGYAEAEPSFDIDGIDTAHKLAILTSLAYHTPPSLDKIHIEGIRGITLRDLEFADELGYTIKLLGITSMGEHGVMQRVHPCMVKKTAPLATVDDVFNAVQVKGDAVGSVFFEGRGAGGGPTGSSVVADIIDLARGVQYHPFISPASKLKNVKHTPFASLETPYYLRLAVIDKPGVLADVTSIFRKESISMQSFIQHSHAPDEAVQLVLTTHKTVESNMLAAMQAIGKLPTVTEPPHMIRIEQP